MGGKASSQSSPESSDMVSDAQRAMMQRDSEQDTPLESQAITQVREIDPQIKQEESVILCFGTKEPPNWVPKKKKRQHMQVNLREGSSDIQQAEQQDLKRKAQPIENESIVIKKICRPVQDQIQVNK